MRSRAALRTLLAATALASLALSSHAGAAQLLTNGSFEAPNIGTGNYTYPGLSYGTIAPIGATQGGWTFSGSALVNGSGGNAWYGGSAPSGMDGAQFVALQNNSTLSQSFMATASTLHLSWLEAGRTWGMGDQSYQILLNGAAAGGLFSTGSDDPFSLNTLTLGGLRAAAAGAGGDAAATSAAGNVWKPRPTYWTGRAARCGSSRRAGSGRPTCGRWTSSRGSGSSTPAVRWTSSR